MFSLEGNVKPWTRGKGAGDKLPRYDMKRSAEVYPRQQWLQINVASGFIPDKVALKFVLGENGQPVMRQA